MSYNNGSDRDRSDRYGDRDSRRDDRDRSDRGDRDRSDRDRSDRDRGSDRDRRGGGGSSSDRDRPNPCRLYVGKASKSFLIIRF